MSSSLAPFLEESVIYWLRHVTLWSIAWETGYDPPRILAEFSLGSFEGHFPIRVLWWGPSHPFPLASDFSLGSERGLWHLPGFFMPVFLGEIPWRHKVWSGGCCSPHPILNHDKVAGAFDDQEGRDAWGVAGVSRADSKKALVFAGGLTDRVPASSFFIF